MLWPVLACLSSLVVGIFIGRAWGISIEDKKYTALCEEMAFWKKAVENRRIDWLVKKEG